MLRTLEYALLLSSGLLAPAGASAATEDKPALSGVWTRTGSELRIEFADKDVMKLFPHGDQAAITIVCQYTIDKDGVVKARVTEFEGKQELKDKIKNVVPLGSAFRFKWQAKEKSATLDDIKGDNVDALKGHLEGQYEHKN